MENLGRVSSNNAPPAVGLLPVYSTANFSLLSPPPVSQDSSYVRYFGNSYLEFGAVELTAVNHITVSFQTAAARGTLLYVDQGPVNAHFFMKLFVMDGLLQVQVHTFVTATASSQFKAINRV